MNNTASYLQEYADSIGRKYASGQISDEKYAKCMDKLEEWFAVYIKSSPIQNFDSN